jgi:hypothetical protein
MCAVTGGASAYYSGGSPMSSCAPARSLTRCARAAIDKPAIDMMSGVSRWIVIDTRLSCARFLAAWLSRPQTNQRVRPSSRSSASLSVARASHERASAPPLRRCPSLRPREPACQSSLDCGSGTNNCARGGSGSSERLWASARERRGPTCSRCGCAGCPSRRRCVSSGAAHCSGWSCRHRLCRFATRTNVKPEPQAARAAGVMSAAFKDRSAPVRHGLVEVIGERDATSRLGRGATIQARQPLAPGTQEELRSPLRDRGRLAGPRQPISGARKSRLGRERNNSAQSPSSMLARTDVGRALRDAREPMPVNVQLRCAAGPAQRLQEGP